MGPDPREFAQKSRDTLGRPDLRQNYFQATQGLRAKRKNAFEGIAASERLQWIGQSIRAEALARLPELLVAFEAKISARGVRVHWAETIEEANAVVLDVARRHGVTLAIKGKSMVSEEMELNHVLERHGIEAIEADLGEFIVQLAHQPPAHIVMPALHMNRFEIADLFRDELGEPHTVDIAELTALARRVLRQKFREAGMGISGVNFAIAETGSVHLIENEGNGRMVTTVPPVHVALMGLEKIIPRLEDLPSLQRLLTRSATGQAISTYFNWLTGPRRPGEQDGPREVHLVIIDNGRSAIYGDGELRETLSCIRCGACINHCPVYARIGGHAYGSPYPGPIGKILTPQMAGLEAGGHLAGASTLCGACYQVCPVKIPIPDILLRLRQEGSQPTAAGQALVKGAGSKRAFGEAMVWKGWQVLHARPAAYRALTRLAALAMKFAPQYAGPLHGWTRHRDLPRPEPRTLHDLMRERTQA